MKNMDKAAKVISRVLEITHWVGAAIIAASIICAAISPAHLGYFVGIDTSESTTEMNVYGFEVTAEVSNGRVETETFIFFAIGAAVILSLMALIFKNLYIIIKNSEGSTPFTAENVRRLRNIGILFTAVPIFGYVMSFISFIFINSAEVRTSLGGLVIAIFMLCLTQFFSRGLELENEVKGLL